MAHEREIAEALQELRLTTDRLMPSPERVDLDRIELAIAERKAAVRRLGRLIEQFPDDFSPGDLDDMRKSQSQGKRALAMIVEMRGRGWTTATQLTNNKYVLRSFAQFGSAPAPDPEG